MATNGAPTGIFVLGMHRSGTSALTATIGLLGANLGDYLIKPREDNKKGFFEDWRCVKLNMELTRHFGTDGRGGVPLPANWTKAPPVRKAAGRVRTILKNLAEQPVYVLKDPRLCLLGDLWLNTAAALGHEVKVIVAARHPLQVAQSLEKRENEPRYRAYMMWLLYCIGAVRVAGNHPRLYVSFDELQSGVEACLRRIAAFVDRPDVVFLDQDRMRRVAEFVDPALVNNREVSDPRFPALSRELGALHAALSAGDEARFQKCLQGGSVRTFVELSSAYAKHQARKEAALPGTPPEAPPQRPKRPGARMAKADRAVAEAG